MDLKELYTSGALTDDEFKAAKKKIIDLTTSTSSTLTSTSVMQGATTGHSIPTTGVIHNKLLRSRLHSVPALNRTAFQQQVDQIAEDAAESA